MTMKLIQRSYTKEQADLLETTGIHPVLAKLWAARGISSVQELSLDLKNLIPPSELTHCEKAAAYLAPPYKIIRRF